MAWRGWTPWRVQSTLGVSRDNADYTVKIELVPVGGSDRSRTDDLTANNWKVFKFRSYLSQ